MKDSNLCSLWEQRLADYVVSGNTDLRKSSDAAVIDGLLPWSDTLPEYCRMLHQDNISNDS